MSDFNPFLSDPASMPGARASAPAAELPLDPRVAQIAEAAGVSAEVAARMVAASEAFEKVWTDKGLPGNPQAMGARGVLCQAAQAICFGMKAPPALVTDYLSACLAETARISAEIEKERAAVAKERTPAAPKAPAPTTSEDDGEDEGDEDDDEPDAA